MKVNNKGLFFASLFILLGGFFVMAKYTPQETGQEIPSHQEGFQFKNVWQFSQKSIGFSSPNLADLNLDGVEDIIIGSGIFEHGGHARPIMAIDGKKGTLLWSYNAQSRVFATPFLMDINEDKVKDVLIGTDHCHKGSSKTCPGLWALNGKNGELLWDLRKVNEGFWKGDVPGFNTISKFGDRILFGQSGGGFEPRPPARLFIAHPKTGKILKEFKAEDNGEVYSIPTLFKHNNVWHALFGTGGEVVKGSLYLYDLLKGKTLWSLPEKKKGWISSPLVHSKEKFIFATSVDSGFYKLDFKGNILWKQKVEGFETYSSPALGNFDNKSGLDMVITTAKGVWPRHIEENRIIWMNGKTGKIIDSKVFGLNGYPSPLIFDLNNDGFDEVLVLINLEAKYPENFEIAGSMKSALRIYDGKTREVLFEKNLNGLSAATPIAKDIDRNGKLDLIVPVAGKLLRFEHPKRTGPKVYWGQFRGNKGNGIF